jgi:6-phosphogluconolactonase
MQYICIMKKLKLSDPGAFAPLVSTHIREVARSHDKPIRIGVPGGRGAIPVIQGLLSCEQEILKRVELYLVDERLTGPSNRDTLMDVGLAKAIEEGLFRVGQLHVPEPEHPFFTFDGDLDLLYLGVGEDGHVASLFPGSFPALDARDCSETAIVPDSPKPPPERITVTWRAFRDHAGKTPVFLLFFGEGKRASFERFLAAKESPSTLPCLFFPREWFSVTIVTDL